MIDRRIFLKGITALTALTIAPKVVKSETIYKNLLVHGKRIVPKKLQIGDTIGLVTPGSPITKEQLTDTVKKLKRLGFNSYYEKTVLSEYGYMAGKDDERASELMGMFTNNNVDGIMCVRGGYSSIRILNKLNYDLIKQNPKVFIGYSDITALLTAIFEKTGLITFHGPLGVSKFTDFTVKCFKKVLMYPSHRYKYPYMREPGTDFNPEFDIYTINAGKARGELIGGNLSVLTSMIGSDFEPDFENKIVYIEEIEEKTYRIDKMLYHLLYATNLKKAAGIVFGVFNKCNINDEPRLTLKQAINDLFNPLDIPISYGFPFGHIDTIITIPTGVMAKFNSKSNKLILLEKAVI